jgi:hypothetical protein
MKKIGIILLISAIIGLFAYLIYGVVNTKPDQILSQNEHYILVKEYKWNNRDSTIYKYSAPKIYTAVVTNKERYSRFVGVPGKGGHTKTYYYITFTYNNTEYKLNDRNLYNKYNKNDRTKIKEVWYPYYRIIVY